jgi:hypothetical protein
MTTMTGYQLADHIKSKDWTRIDRIYSGSEVYNCNIGLYRMMFGVDEPDVMIMLFGEKTEVWAKTNNNCEKVF